MFHERIHLRNGLRAAAITVLFVLSAAYAEAEAGEDHPLISRYPGSELAYSEVREYDEYVLPIAPLEQNRLSETLQLEGKVTHLQYRIQDRSTLEIYRNFESALRQAGFEILFEFDTANYGVTYRWVHNVYDPHGLRWKSTSNSSFMGDGFRYLAARSGARGADAYVALYTSTRSGRTIIQLDIIEETPMDAGMITVDADRLKGEIERLGFVAIYDVFFVPDSAEIRGDSGAALRVIADFLNSNPGMRFYAVGHTTNIGDHDYLMDLSARRAEAMVNLLVNDYGVAEGVLAPAGVGPLSPVATNETPTGQGLNRRVELVLRR